MSSDDWTPPVDPVAGVISRSDYITYALQNVQALKNGLVGDSSADAAIMHQHKTGTLRARPAPGNGGRLYVPTDLPILLIDDGTEWVIPDHSGHSVMTECQEFSGVPPEDIAPDRSAWIAATASGGSVTGSGGDDDTIWKLLSGTTSGGVAAVGPNSPANTDFLSSRKYIMVCRFKTDTPAGSNQQFQMGMQSTDGSTPTEAVFIRKVDAGNVFGVVRTASTDRIASDFGVDGGSIVTAIFEYDGTDIKIYKDTFNAGGLLGTLSATIPTAQMAVMARIIISSTNAREFHPDYFCLHMARA